MKPNPSCGDIFVEQIRRDNQTNKNCAGGLILKKFEGTLKILQQKQMEINGEICTQKCIKVNVINLSH